MSQRFVSLNGLRPVLIPADYPNASLKWCYLHLKEQDWESSSFLAQLCSDLLCYSLSWQTRQIHTHRAVINNLNLAAKEQVRRGESEGWFHEWLHPSHGCIGRIRCVSAILLSSHPPHIPQELGMGNSNNSYQEGQYKPLVPWLSLNHAPAMQIYWKSNMMLHIVWKE